MSKSEASPRPWHIDDGFGTEIYDSRGLLVADAYDGDVTPMSKTNAALIVRAVNAHDDLVDAAERLIAACGNSGPTCPVCGPFRAALTKARAP